MIKSDKYCCLYPSTLEVVYVTKDNIDSLLDSYTFYQRTKDLRSEEINKEGVKDFLQSELKACVYSALNLETEDYCVLVIIKSMKDDIEATACHEAVHVADYYFELCGMNTEDFSYGDEPYAYLVQWCFECIIKSINKWKKE